MNINIKFDKVDAEVLHGGLGSGVGLSVFGVPSRFDKSDDWGTSGTSTADVTSKPYNNRIIDAKNRYINCSVVADCSDFIFTNPYDKKVTYAIDATVKYNNSIPRNEEKQENTTVFIYSADLVFVVLRASSMRLATKVVDAFINIVNKTNAIKIPI